MGQCWKTGFIDTNEGAQAARQFDHPKREGFPNLYLLLEPHPLRPQHFTPANYPRCGRESFNDYVLTIHKNSDFMEHWQEVGLQADTPADDISLNQENGMSPPDSFLGHT